MPGREQNGIDLAERRVPTGYAEKVRRQYHESFVPQAIETGVHFHAENPDGPKLIRETSAWLILGHLNSRGAGEVAALGAGVRVGADPPAWPAANDAYGAAVGINTSPRTAVMAEIGSRSKPSMRRSLQLRVVLS
ncbi:hypothetical protein RCCGEPOP_19573 [Rhizobium sp. Pop5]|nr:hypothetical protein RCCGEPOP_19573 [Rhizobium sp. Pop5]